MGWCSAGSHGEVCDRQECESIGATYSETPGSGGCPILRVVDDDFAREMVESTVWSPIVKVRDQVLPKHLGGTTVVADIERHFDEIVTILRADKALLFDVIRYCAAMGPFLRAMSGETIPVDESLSSRTSSRLRPGMVDWTTEILRRAGAPASKTFKATLARYESVLPTLQNLTPREVLAALDDRRVVSKLQATV